MSLYTNLICLGIIILLVLLGLFLIKPRTISTFTSSFTSQSQENGNPNCPSYTIVDQTVESTNYNPYLEVSNDIFYAFLNSIYPSLSTPSSTSTTLESISNWIVQSVFTDLNTNWAFNPANKEGDLFTLINVCTLQTGTMDNTTTLYTWLLTIYRKEYNYGFQLQYNTSVINGTTRFQHYNVLIVGNIKQQDVVSYPSITASTDDLGNGDWDANAIMSSNTEQADVMLNRIVDNHNAINEMAMLCYGQPDYTRRKSCISKYNKYGELKERGYWDRPCIKNEDCPYWMANTNYPNKRGGCNTQQGWCEMPINVKQVSFTQASSYVPYCYNCSDQNDYTCCEQQKRKTDTDYGLLASPDYAFEADIKERQQYQDSLKERGLVVSGYKNIDDQVSDGLVQNQNQIQFQSSSGSASGRASSSNVDTTPLGKATLITNYSKSAAQSHQ